MEGGVERGQGVAGGGPEPAPAPGLHQQHQRLHPPPWWPGHFLEENPGGPAHLPHLPLPGVLRLRDQGAGRPGPDFGRHVLRPGGDCPLFRERMLFIAGRGGGGEGPVHPLPAEPGGPGEAALESGVRPVARLLVRLRRPAPRCCWTRPRCWRSFSAKTGCGRWPPPRRPWSCGGGRRPSSGPSRKGRQTGSSTT